jgi:hypothetical protein
MTKIPFSLVLGYRSMTFSSFWMNQSRAFVRGFGLDLIVRYCFVRHEDGACIVFFVVANSEACLHGSFVNTDMFSVDNEARNEKCDVFRSLTWLDVQP